MVGSEEGGVQDSLFSLGQNNFKFNFHILCARAGRYLLSCALTSTILKVENKKRTEDVKINGKVENRRKGF